MTTVDEAKAMARRLRSGLEARGQSMSHSESLELVAAQLGYRDWNTASALLGARAASDAPDAEPSADEFPSQEWVVKQLHEVRSKMMAHFEETPHPRAHDMLSRINNKIAEEERKFAAWRKAQEWQALGLFREGMEVPIGCPDILKKVAEWQKIGEIDLPHPERPHLVYRAGIYEVCVQDAAVRFAAVEVGQATYAFYVPRDDPPDRTAG